MTMFRNSKMYYGDGLGEQCPCEVRISGGTIAISYQGDSGPVVYEGPEVEPGHFRLTAQSVNGRASLHRLPDDAILEGSWSEGGYEGMWRIELDE